MKHIFIALFSIATLTSCSTVHEYTGGMLGSKEKVVSEARRTPVHNRNILSGGLATRPAGYALPNSAPTGNYNAQLPQANAFANPNQPPLVITQAQAPQYSAPVQLPTQSVLNNPNLGNTQVAERRNPSFNSETLGFAPVNIPPAPSPVPQISQSQLPPEFTAPTDRGIVTLPPSNNEYPKLAQVPSAPVVSSQPAKLDARVQELKRDLEVSKNQSAGMIEVSDDPITAPIPSPMVKAPVVSVTPVAKVEAPMLKPIAVEPMIKRSVDNDSYTPPAFEQPSYSAGRQAMTTVGDLRAPASLSRRSRGASKKTNLPARYTNKDISGSRHSGVRRSYN